MSSPQFKLDGNTPTISWADPKNAPDPSAAAQVNEDLWKALYRIESTVLQPMCSASLLHDNRALTTSSVHYFSFRTPLYCIFSFRFYVVSLI